MARIKVLIIGLIVLSASISIISTVNANEIEAFQPGNKWRESWYNYFYCYRTPYYYTPGGAQANCGCSCPQHFVEVNTDNDHEIKLPLKCRCPAIQDCTCHGFSVLFREASSSMRVFIFNYTYSSYGQYKIIFINQSGGIIGEFSVGEQSGVVEFIIAPDGAVYQYVNGVPAEPNSYRGVIPLGELRYVGLEGSFNRYGSIQYGYPIDNFGIGKNGVVGLITSTDRHNVSINDFSKDITVEWIASHYERDKKLVMKVYDLAGQVFINETTVKEASDTNVSGSITYNLSKLLGEEAGNKFGTYQIRLYEETDSGSNILDWDYLNYYDIEDPSWLNIERAQYSRGATMNVSYYVSNFVSGSFQMKVYDSSGLKATKILTTSTGTVSFDTSDYEVGTVIALIENTDTYNVVASDVAEITNTVFIWGYAYNGYTGEPLQNVSVVIRQGDMDYEALTGTDGKYVLLKYGMYNGNKMNPIAGSTEEWAELSSNTKTFFNASKEGYWHDNFSITFLRPGTFRIDLYLLPNCENLPHTNHTVAGLTLENAFHQKVSNANVNIFNSSNWTDSTTSSSTGFYNFTDLYVKPTVYNSVTNEEFNSSEYGTAVSLDHKLIKPGSQNVTDLSDTTVYYNNTDYTMDYINGTITVLSTGNMSNNTNYHIDYGYVDHYELTNYSLNATKENYIDSPDEDVQFNSSGGECIYKNLLLGGLYNITIRCYDAETSAIIKSFSIIFNDEITYSTDNLKLVINGVHYGVVKLQADASGYYPQIKYVYVYRDTGVNFYLTKMSNETQYPSGPGAYYAPHSVEFRFQDLFGNPVPGATVNATPIETSLGSWDWLEKLYGYSSDVDLRNTTLSGETGTDGTVTFTMVDTIKYRVTVDDKQRGITKTIDIYPKDDHYTIVVGFLISSVNRDAEINATFTTHEINDTARVFNVLYIDTGNKTESVNFTVYAKPTDEVGNFTLVYSEIKTGSTVNFSYTAMNWRNTTYYIGYEATMDDGTKRSETRGYEYHIRRILWDLGLKPEEYQYYTWISIALLILVGAMFSGITVRYGAVFVPMFALLLWYVGWLRFAGDIAILGVAMVLGVLFYYKEKSREEAMG